MEHDPDLEGRLRAVGAQPIDPELQSAHLARMTSAVRSARRRAKVRVAGIVMAGVLVGSSSLAAAGVLPDPAQHLAHRAFDTVGVGVPDPERYHGPECGAEVKKNHGAYVRDDHALGASQCGKKVHAKTGAAGDDEDGAEEPKAEKGPCQGPPPWAGKDKASMTPEEKAKAQADRTAQCGADDEGDDGQETADDPAVTEREATTTTTTTAPSTTTTTVAPSTTTTEGTTTSTTP